MAHAIWCSVNPTEGSGNKTVSVSGATHTGRTARQTTLTITAANVEPVTVQVNQSGKPEFIDSQDTAAVVKDGQVLTISGKSNSSKLTFSLGTGYLNLEMPATYTANSVTTTNGEPIDGDPGQNAEYDFSIKFTVAKNEGITELTRQLIVTDEGGHTDTCLITQAAGDSTLSVSKNTIELDYEGNAQSFEVISNASWKIV